MLHVFVDSVDSSDQMIHINGREYEPGDEIWAFIPGEFLPRLKGLKDARSHQYFTDGAVSLYTSDTGGPPFSGLQSGKTGKYDHKVLVFGERRGGRCYWALDVSEPDPGKWFVRWRIKGGDGKEDFSPELGYSWSKPTFAAYQESSSRLREVVIFGGGYDPEEDHFPEAWFDGNYDGIYSPGDRRDIFDIHNPKHDSWDNDRYDVYNPEQNEMGRGIFMVDVWDGSPVFQVTYGQNNMNGIHQKHEDMKWCFPADPTIISYPGVFVIYAADVYGQIWKVDNKPFAGKSKWEVKRIFQANPGSDQTDAMDALSVEPSLKSSDFGRKLFHSPDVSYKGTEWSNVPVLYFVTGDREHPLYIPAYENRLYVVSDTDTAAHETDLINLTCNELDNHSDVNQDGSLEYGDGPNNHDEILRGRLQDILYGFAAYPEKTKRCRGWYRILGRQGDCLGATLDHQGEMGLGRPVLFFNAVYFSTFQPGFEDLCKPGGNSFLYTMDYSDGRAVRKKNQSNMPDIRSIEDTFQVMEDTGIPSEIKLIIRPEGTSAFVCSGSGIIGLGAETDSATGNPSNIPSPPGGVQRLMWKMH
jgi:type IV pilus assembly protein PilY1